MLAADINYLIGSIPALLGGALGVWLTDRYSSKRWLQQQQWTVRQKCYMDVLTQLRKAEMALQEQNVYYMEPGSEHNDYRKDEYFMKQGRAVAAALDSAQELAGPAQVFLSQKAIDALEHLSRENWNAGETAVCDADYIERVLSVVKTTRATVAAEARSELTGRQRQLES